MLELKENRKDSNYDANLVWNYKIEIRMARHTIKKYGLQVFLGQEDPPADKKDMMMGLMNIPVDERRDIYNFMERNPQYSDEQLAKELFRECEYYCGW